MVHFHEPLSTTLAALAPGAEFYPLRENHGITTFLVLKMPTTRHARDLSPATLSSVVWKHPNLLGLLRLRVSAWETVGFFPDDATVLWEYPTAVDLLTSLLGTGVRVLDIGGGVNPLVPYLAAQGYEVETVDPSPERRDWAGQQDWNEGGFLDYAQAGLAHRSWNCTLDQLPVTPSFDAALWLRGVERLPVAARRPMLRDIAERVRPGGLAVMMVCLERGGNHLQNEVDGLIVESKRRHGTMRRVVKEAKRSGFDASDVRTVRNWGDSRFDIGLVVLHRRSGPMGARRSAGMASVRGRLGAVRKTVPGSVRRPHPSIIDVIQCRQAMVCVETAQVVDSRVVQAKGCSQPRPQLGSLDVQCETGLTAFHTVSIRCRQPLSALLRGSASSMKALRR